ncbi:MAG: glycoside hydrolase family 32 protein [Ethanoligenens sp.]
MNLYRPTYHFSTEKNWINDPNGPIYLDGYYHLFYQYNPTGDCWGNIHWGHARSSDLINWETLPIALQPSAERGELHCFSGCAALENGAPAILYTSVGSIDNGPRTPRYGAELWAAHSSDGGITWVKDPGNPVLTQAAHGDTQISEWRDPYVWREGADWMLVQGGSIGGHGCVLRYRGKDLSHWTYLGPLFLSADFPFLECPNILPFGEQYMLFYSPNDSVRYHIGTIGEDGLLREKTGGILDHGGKTFYAPNTLLNAPEGRLLTWGWIQEDGRGSTFSGWSGMMSLPRVYTLENSSLRQEPAREYQLLRQEPERLPVDRLSGSRAAFHHRGRAYEVLIEMTVEQDSDFSLVVLASPDGSELTRLHYSARNDTLTMERGLSSMAENTNRNFWQMPVHTQGGRLSLRIFVDHSVVEIFANCKEAMTGRVYPIRPDSDTVYLEGQTSNVSATLWPLEI